MIKDIEIIGLEVENTVENEQAVENEQIAETILESLTNYKANQYRGLEVIDLDFEVDRDQQYSKTSKSALDKKQRDDLRGFYESVNNDIQITKDILDKGLYGIIFKVVSTLYKNVKLEITIAVLLVLFIIFTPIIHNMHQNNYMITEAKEVEYTGSSIYVDVNDTTHKLDISINNLSIETASGFLNSDIQELEFNNIETNKDSYNINDITYKILSELHLNKLDIQNDYVYVQYINDNNTASKELVWAEEKPSNISTDTLSKIDTRFFEKSSPLQIKTCINSYDNSFLMLMETISGGELKTDSLIDTLVNIENNITTSQKLNTNSEITLEISELGSIKLSELTEISGETEILYDHDTDILRIYNSADNIDYVYIYEINNKLMNYNIENLVETSNERVYVNTDFNNKESNDYNTVIVKGETKVYCIKVSDIVNDTLLYNILNQLGIKIDSIEL